MGIYSRLGLVALWSLAVIGVAIAYLASTRPVAPRGNAKAFEDYITRTLGSGKRSFGSAAVMLVRQGEVVSAQGFGEADGAQSPVQLDRTLYQMASVSKVVTAWGVMALVEKGAIALDEPVSSYLSRWQFPPSPYEAVTVRQLLSHTAGLEDGFGYAGFPPGEPLQSLEESLTLARDPAAGEPRGVAVTQPPGQRWRYSGGGYTVLQLLIEEVTGQPFAEYMDEAVLQPLGMTGASFDWEQIRAAGRGEDLAASVDATLKRSPHRRYTATAAASLYATPADMAAFVRAYYGDNPVLGPASLAEMMTPQPGTAGIWGLGHGVYMKTDGGLVVGHDGANLPALNHTVRVDPATGDGVVVMVSGSADLASRLGDDWVYWQTGKRTADALIREVLALLPLVLVLVGAGAAVIFSVNRFAALPSRLG